MIKIIFYSVHLKCSPQSANSKGRDCARGCRLIVTASYPEVSKKE